MVSGGGGWCQSASPLRGETGRKASKAAARAVVELGKLGAGIAAAGYGMGKERLTALAMKLPEGDQANLPGFGHCACGRRESDL